MRKGRRHSRRHLDMIFVAHFYPLEVSASAGDKGGKKLTALPSRFWAGKRSPPRGLWVESVLIKKRYMFGFGLDTMDSRLRVYLHLLRRDRASRAGGGLRPCINRCNYSARVTVVLVRPSTYTSRRVAVVGGRGMEQGLLKMRFIYVQSCDFHE